MNSLPKENHPSLQDDNIANKRVYEISTVTNVEAVDRLLVSKPTEDNSITYQNLLDQMKKEITTELNAKMQKQLREANFGFTIRMKKGVQFTPYNYNTWKIVLPTLQTDKIEYFTYGERKIDPSHFIDPSTLGTNKPVFKLPAFKHRCFYTLTFSYVVPTVRSSNTRQSLAIVPPNVQVNDNGEYIDKTNILHTMTMGQYSKAVDFQTFNFHLSTENENDPLIKDGFYIFFGLQDFNIKTPKTYTFEKVSLSIQANYLPEE